MDWISPTPTTPPPPPPPPQPKRRRNVSQFSAASLSIFDDAASSRAPSSMAGSDDDDDADDAYRVKRSRNNAAVRKSRERSKAKSGQAETHLRQLRKENFDLEKREKMLAEELELLKESFLKQMTEHLARSRAFDAVAAVGAYDDDDDAGGNNDDNNNNNDENGNVSLVLNADQICFFNAGAGISSAAAAAAAVVPPTPWKDDVVVVGNASGATLTANGRGVIDLKKEKELRKISNKNARL